MPPTADSADIRISLPGTKDPRAAAPRLLQSATRAAGGAADPFLGDAVLKVGAVYDLTGVRRGEAAAATVAAGRGQLMALEAEDGTTIFVRADKLREDLQRVRPEAVRDGGIDLGALRLRDAASRGIADWVWERVTFLTLGRDAIVEAAERQAANWLRDALGAKLAESAQEAGILSASWLGAKALMWAIESRLAGEQGLYEWRGGELASADFRPRGDARLDEAARRGPLLVFIHGTGSHTLAGFRDLAASGAAGDWDALRAPFGERVYGFEHRTFSESPIDNALRLADALPANARVTLVTHSRGGLVGDLLCLDPAALGETLIGDYRREPRPGEKEAPWARAIREKVAADEQDKLRALRDLLRAKQLRVERYVRVACPASGTRLLSDNLDVFLSGLLSLASAVVGAVAGPAASPVLSAFKRVVLEIADKRVAPELVPGIEAMLTDAPLGRLLAQAPRVAGVEMGVIAGDIEGGGILQSLGVLFTDWMFFDHVDNDLVVDTESMYGGLARGAGTRYLFDQGEGVSHFRYFGNARTRAALRDWVAGRAVDALPDWSPIEELAEPGKARALERRRSREATRGTMPPNTRPVVFLLPGIMGSHLEIRTAGAPGEGNRVWFDVFGLAKGDLEKIRFGAPDVREESLFEMFYGDLLETLEGSHRVVPFPYDWRLPVQDTADRLAAAVGAALAEHPDQPVRLLAHSMGGLVARAMIARHAELWEEMARRPGGRFVMLGTPNNGSHLMVESLVGKSGTVRKLAMIDLKHPLQGVLDIIAGFPGALQLLPRPGFQDAGGAQRDDYLVGDVWQEFRRVNRDRWFGDGVGALPAAGALGPARSLWESVLLVRDGSGGRWRHRPIPHPERVAYVFGQAENTACGIKVESGRLLMVGTPEGDGSVSWASGRMDFLPDERCWYMPAEHGSLADTEEHFPAIVDLLEQGETDRLSQRAPVSRGAAALRTYDAAPVGYPTEAEVERSLLGARPKRRRVRRGRQLLSVQVRAMDLRSAQTPLLCGHYIGDPISGAESQIDRVLVGGKLRQRERLGIYAGAIGTSAVVLEQRGAAQPGRFPLRGAIVVGLGEFGTLTVSGVTETVRAGALRYLLHAGDRALDEAVEGDGARQPLTELRLASLLIGYNSTANIGVEDSVAAIVRGVCEANRQFEDAMGGGVRIAHLEFVELYLDVAITAAHAVRDLPQRMARDFERLDARVAAAAELTQGEGCRTRLSVSTGGGYWPRLMVTDADRGDEACPPECYQVRRLSPVPAELRRELLDELRREQGLAPAAAPDAAPPPAAAGAAPRPASSIVVAERLKFVYLGERARAEAIVHQRQPGLVEALIRDAIRTDRYNAELARSLFQLMVPLGFKASARDAGQLLLVLDGYTANLPWEMLRADDVPMVCRTAVVRQLVSTRFRPVVRSSGVDNALVIVNPSTDGYLEHFGAPGEAALPDLAGAVEEGETVREILTAAGYSVLFAPSGSLAADVFNKLFARPCRVLVIAAHGVFEARRRDGTARSGVVLSDGVLLTAAEVGQMEIVPDLVFLNCCHLGKMGATTAYNRLAYSLARELIEMGVRCVVVAGWAVNDQAAHTFAKRFFAEFVQGNQPFGRAVHEARKETYALHRASNTWGAYQAYGDPGFQLRRMDAERGDTEFRPVSLDEVIDRIESLRAGVTPESSFRQSERAVRRLLAGAPAAWAQSPRLQAALGEFYGDHGSDGFAAARAALLRAIGEQDTAGSVPVRAIERLANLEARAGALAGGEAGLALVESAIGRINALIQAAGGDGAAALRNVERWSLLGSAWKRKAAVQAQAGAAAEEVEKSLRQAREAYATAAGDPADPGFSPWAMINRLQLDAVLEGAQADIAALAERCKAVAAERFERSYHFFDAKHPVDADLALHLQRGTLPAAREPLLAAFRDVARRAPQSARQWDSVVDQLRLLEVILRALGGRDGAAGTRLAQADALAWLQARLAPRGSAPPPVAPPAGEPPASGRRRGGRPAKPRAARKPRKRN